MRLLPLMMKLGAESDPMLPLNEAMEERKAAHDCGSTGGTSARDVGMSGVLSLLVIVLESFAYRGTGCSDRLVGRSNLAQCPRK